MSDGVYPLIFRPIFKPRIWGGRRLGALLGKRLPEGQSIGESWEVADLEEDQSVVAHGPARGKSLVELVQTWGSDLTGGAALFEGRFPLLIKFLDAADRLSVQVHPDRAAADRLGGRVRIKNEAWYVIEADPEAFIYHGLREGVDAERLRRAIREGHVEDVLRRVEVRKGHCYHLPSGTVHALGRGLVVAEVQTPSDVTYRMFDWNRIEPSTGRARELHVEEALECASLAPIEPEQTPQHTASVWASVTGLCRSESFVIERVRLVEGVEMRIPHAEMVIWIVLEGTGSIAHDGAKSPVEFATGDTVVLPAALRSGSVRARSNTLWLEVTVPVRSPMQGVGPPPRDGFTGLRVGAGYVPLTVNGTDVAAGQG